MQTETVEAARHIQKFGYEVGRGLGGSVTQQTDRSTGVTLNGLVGVITTNTASLAAEAAATFGVTNNQVEANDVVVAAMAGGSNSGNTAVNVSAIGAGGFSIRVSNNNAGGGTAETGAIVINFIVLKGAVT